MRTIGVERPGTRVLLLAVALFTAGCGTMSEAELRAQWQKDPAAAADYIAKHDVILGYDKRRVAALLGSDGVGRDPRQGEWTNNCSGNASCYALVVTYGKNGRVTSIAKLDEGS